MPDMKNMASEQLSGREAAVSVSERNSRDITSLEADEQTREHLPEQKDAILHAESVSELEAAQNAVPPHTSTQTGSSEALGKDEVIIEVEKILEEGMGDFYADLPAEAKPLFRQKGEEAASVIADMVRSMRVNVKKIVDAISRWLKTIPGVNMYFLEQETKIKTDRILELVEARKEDQSKAV
ncbi:hypothetical protein FBR07_03395 [Candidatus Uhrbacteria bacterium UHB]|nr:hypothetical protein [Candidatus Uhrbacteria bacterium UHB]